jgi:hypothetical protein
MINQIFRSTNQRFSVTLVLGFICGFLLLPAYFFHSNLIFLSNNDEVSNISHFNADICNVPNRLKKIRRIKIELTNKSFKKDDLITIDQSRRLISFIFFSLFVN